MSPLAVEQSPQQLAQLAKEGALSFNDLHFLRFSPYYPRDQAKFENFSANSLQQIDIAHNFFQVNQTELQDAGLIAASIVGSTAVGLATASRYDCHYQVSRDRLTSSVDAIKLNRGSINQSDIDVHIIAPDRDKEVILRLLHSFNHNSDHPCFDFRLYTVEAINREFKHKNLSALVNFGVWQSDIPIYSEEKLTEIQIQARDIIKDLDANEKNDLWQCVVENISLNNTKRRVKQGLVNQALLTKYQFPVLFRYIFRL